VTASPEVMDAPQVCAEPVEQSAQAAPVIAVELEFSEDNTPLTESERQELESCEKQMGCLREAAFQTGSSLKTIQEKRLYREASCTFEKYCEAKWKMSAQNAYRLINAAKIISVLRDSHQVGDKDLPTCESHLRPLADGLEEDQWLNAWQQVLEEAEGEAVTAPRVKKVVNKINGTQEEQIVGQPAKAPKGLRSVITLVEQAKERAEQDKQKAMITLLKKIEEKINSYLKSLVKS